MDSEKQIINSKGARWKHCFLNKLAHSKEFPARLRLFTWVRQFFGLDLLFYKTPSGLNLLLDLTDWVQYQVYLHGSYEAKSLILFRQLSTKATVIFDIGAHIGQYALECAIADKEQAKQIFAIEVNPKTFTYLLNNIQLNKFKNITPVLGAVAPAHDLLNIIIPAYWNMGNTQIAGHKANNDFNNYLAASFSILSLTEKYDLKHIDLVKIDVEGHELAVLKSLFAGNIFPANIILEFIPEAFPQCPDLIILLQKHNYTLKDIDGNLYNEGNILPEQNLWGQRI